MSRKAASKLVAARIPLIDMAVLLSPWFLLMRVLPATALLMSHVLRSRHQRGLCLKCGYNLRSNGRHNALSTVRH